MADVRLVHVVSTRVLPLDSGSAKAVGIEIVALDSDRFVLTMSGGGLRLLAEAIEAFLVEHPQHAETKSPRRQ